MKNCFDSEKYLALQKAKILERIEKFPKLYLEFGGKLLDDRHAARVLPGFFPDLKLRLLKELKDKIELIIPVNANDIEKDRFRADRMITYKTEVCRLIEFFRENGLMVKNIVITLYDGQKKAKIFKRELEENYGVKVYFHTPTKGYPDNVKQIVSDEGYGKNEYIETERPIVVVTAPGPGSGKLATCLSQLYHEMKRGVKAGYAKFETFPVWDLPVESPTNLAYEAATADIDDKNMVDTYHVKKYGVDATNYNRDMELFPVLREILFGIYHEDIYFSPTDMGVNVISKCITNKKNAEKAAKQEVVRRLIRAKMDVKRGRATEKELEAIVQIAKKLKVSEKDRKVYVKAEEKKAKAGTEAACIEVGGDYILGRRTDYLMPTASVILNTLKKLTKIPDEVDLIAKTVLRPMLDVKNQTSNFHESHLRMPEVLLALSICSTTNPMAKLALDNLSKLEGAEFHATYMLGDEEMIVLNNLGMNATTGECL